MSAATIIAEEPPRDGREWDCQCARCGGEMESALCNWCEGSGQTEEGELYEDDPLFYDPRDTAPCHECGGKGDYGYVCCNSKEWCEANPLEGREKTERGTVEWFPVKRDFPPEEL